MMEKKKDMLRKEGADVPMWMVLKIKAKRMVGSSGVFWEEMLR
jgi:hypothetical protein